jgi:hypothetical protein
MCFSLLKSEVEEGAATLMARRSPTELCVRFGVWARPATRRTRSRRAAKVVKVQVQVQVLRAPRGCVCKLQITAHHEPKTPNSKDPKRGGA